MQNPFEGMSISALATRIWDLKQHRARCLDAAAKALNEYGPEDGTALLARAKIRDAERAGEELTLARSAKKGAEIQEQMALLNRALSALRTVPLDTPSGIPESVLRAVATARDLLREAGARNE